MNDDKKLGFENVTFRTHEYIQVCIDLRTNIFTFKSGMFMKSSSCTGKLFGRTSLQLRWTYKLYKEGGALSVTAQFYFSAYHLLNIDFKSCNELYQHKAGVRVCYAVQSILNHHWKS